jgi:hypothetical protein
VVERSGRVSWLSAIAIAGRAFRAAQPHTEFTTTSVVPSWRSVSSTCCAVLSSSTPRRVSSSRIGRSSISGYGISTLRFWFG